MVANLPLIVVHAVLAAFLAWAVVLGIQHRTTTGGKIAIGVFGILLLLHVAFMALVALIVVSGIAGHPF